MVHLEGIMQGLHKLSHVPFNRVALLQPIPGGHVTITSQSSQIFQLFKTSNLVLQVLLTSLQSHINNYCKGGKMAAILTTKSD